MHAAKTEPTPMFRRKTADGVVVQGWTDGALTKTYFATWVARSLPREMLWLIAGEVELYDESELKSLVKAARKLYDKHLRDPRRVTITPGALRFHARNV